MNSLLPMRLYFFLFGTSVQYQYQYAIVMNSQYRFRHRASSDSSRILPIRKMCKLESAAVQKIYNEVFCYNVTSCKHLSDAKYCRGHFIWCLMTICMQLPPTIEASCDLLQGRKGKMTVYLGPMETPGFAQHTIVVSCQYRFRLVVAPGSSTYSFSTCERGTIHRQYLLLKYCWN